MAVAAQLLGVDFVEPGEHVDGSPHVEDVLPGHALAVDHVPQELEPFVPVSLQFPGRVLSFLEAQSVGAEDDVPFTRQGRAGVVHRVAGQACRFAFAEMILSGVLVPDGDARGRFGRCGRVGDQQQGRHTIVGFDFVAETQQAVALFLLGLGDPGLERGRVGPVSAESRQQALTKVDGGHGVSCWN